jgi:putative aldouronate transport system substrate-binding protein
MLAAMLVTVVSSACSSNNESKDGSTPAATQADQTAKSTSPVLSPYKLKMAIPVFGAVPGDVSDIEAKINAITQAKINTTVTISPISIGAWGQQMNLMTSGGEKLDLAYEFGQSYGTSASSKRLKEIDALLDQYGKGVAEAVGADYLKAARVEGKLYGVPLTGSYSTQSGIAMRKDLVEKYKIDIASIKSIEDLDSVFKTIKENEPGIVPLASGLASPLEYYRWYDRLSDRIGVLPDYDNGLKLENYFASKKYADTVTLMHKWFKAGYINKDAATTQTDGQEMVKANKAFSVFVVNKPGSEASLKRSSGYDMVIANLQPNAYSTTSDILTGLWTIVQQSENPERAMMMLNLMYTNSDIANLLAFGIEGKHYVKVSANQVDVPNGAKSLGFGIQPYQVGNIFLTYLPKSEAMDLYEQTKAGNKTAMKSKAIGFSFNSESVKNEITAINNVMTQYRKGLETGTVDPADKLEEFNSKLKAAGIDKVIVEKQKQLDKWAATK